MLLHVSTFKMSSSGSSLCLAKFTYRFSGLSKIKFLKYQYNGIPGRHGHNISSACIYSLYANLLVCFTINILYFNKFILLRSENLYIILARHDEIPEDDILNV